MVIEGQSRLGHNTFPSLALLRPRIYKSPVCPLFQVSFSLWLTIQSFCAKKSKLQKFSKPPKKWTTRRNEIVNALKSDKDNIAIVAYSEYVKHNIMYYYDQRQFVQCATYLKY